MMNYESRLLNWLRIALSQSPNLLSESFYYDKENQEFFSILITDYFMFDEKLEIDKSVTTSYSEENLKKIVKKIKRIENNDKSIIAIPRLTNQKRKAILDNFIESLPINLTAEKQRLKEEYYFPDNTSLKNLNIFDKHFEIEGEESIIEKWTNFKENVLSIEAETFLNINAIPIHSTKIWDVEESGDITISIK